LSALSLGNFKVQFAETRAQRIRQSWRRQPLVKRSKIRAECGDLERMDSPLLERILASEVVMNDIGMNLAALFGGTLSGAFGFFLIAVIFAMFIIPGLLISRHDGKPAPDETNS
jgi:hypothetical protein